MGARLVTTVIVGLVLTACSQAPPIPDDSGDSQGNASSTKKKPKTAAKDDAGLSDGDPFGDDDSSDPAPAKTDCAAEKSQAACFTCCQNASPKAAKILNDAYTSCACRSPGACASPCAQSLCAGKQPKTGDACDACLADQRDTCGEQAASACAADATCDIVFTCADDASCFEKP